MSVKPSAAWRDPIWLQSHPPLDENNVFEYFKRSTFYDSSCINEVLSMQSQGTHKRNMSQVDGIYYTIAPRSTDARLFVITRNIRSQGQENREGVYLVVGAQDKRDSGTIYQLPTMHNVLRVNITNAAYYLDQCIEELSGMVGTMDIIDGQHHWKHEDDIRKNPPKTNIYEGIVSSVLAMEFERVHKNGQV